MIPSWMGNGWTLTWFTVGSLFLSHAVSYFLANEKIRLSLAYMSLLLGGAALLTSFHSALGTVNTQKSQFAAANLESAQVDVHKEILAAEHYLCSFKGMRTANSPPSFDEIEEQRKLACQLFGAIKHYADTEWDPKKAVFAPPNANTVSIYDHVWRQSFDRLDQVVEIHAKALEALQRLQPEPWLFWSALEPFIIALSWSMGLALMLPARWRH